MRFVNVLMDLSKRKDLLVTATTFLLMAGAGYLFYKKISSSDSSTGRAPKRKQRFNIALVPESIEVNDHLRMLASTASIEQGLQPQYLLEEGKSLPHISVIQFEVDISTAGTSLFQQPVEELLSKLSEIVEAVWLEVCEQHSEELLCQLSDKINYKHDTAGDFAGVSWCELLVDKNKNPVVNAFHMKMLDKISRLGIKCLNGHGDKYNPHFTLFNIDTRCLNDENKLLEIPDKSVLCNHFPLKPAIGKANMQWELESVEQNDHVGLIVPTR